MGIKRRGKQGNMIKNCFLYLRVGVDFLRDVSILSILMVMTIHGLYSEKKEYMFKCNLKN